MRRSRRYFLSHAEATPKRRIGCTGLPLSSISLEKAIRRRPIFDVRDRSSLGSPSSPLLLASSRFQLMASADPSHHDTAIPPRPSRVPSIDRAFMTSHPVTLAAASISPRRLSTPPLCASTPHIKTITTERSARCCHYAACALCQAISLISILRVFIFTAHHPSAS